MKRLPPTLLAVATAVGIAATSGAEAKSPTATAASSSSSCSAAKLRTHTHGVLTIATGAPAYSPYFIHNDPSNGEGFESAVAYAVAKFLHFKSSEVKWVVESPSAADAPGKKDFDFDINETVITPALGKDVAVSIPYFTDPQAVIVNKGGVFRNVKKLAGLANAVIGVPLNTTSLQAVTDLIDPLQQAAAYDDSSDEVEAYKEKDVNVIVTDLGTAIDLVHTELPNDKVLGQFPYPGSDTWGLVLQKHSPLTQCVDRALGYLKGTGTLAKLTSKWIVSVGKIPVLKP